MIFKLRSKSSARNYFIYKSRRLCMTGMMRSGMVVYIGMLEEREHQQMTMWLRRQVVFDQ